MDQAAARDVEAPVRAPAPAAAGAGPAVASPLLAMQASGGNAAVLSMLGQDAPPQTVSRMHVGADGDAAERDADRVATDVMTRLDQPVGAAASPAGPVQRVADPFFRPAADPAAPIRRFMAVDDFKAMTYEGMLVGSSTAQNEIVKLLKQYAALGAPPKGTKPPPKGAAPPSITVPDDKLDAALALVRAMKTGAELWLAARTKEETQKDGTTKVVAKKEKRAAGFERFKSLCLAEIIELEDRKAFNLTAQMPVEVDTKGVQKMKDRYEGGLGTCLGGIGYLIGTQVAEDGDSMELEANLKCPVPPNAFVGGILRFEAKKDGGNVEIGCEALFQGGGSIAVLDIHGALGGYLKAAAPTAERAMKLVSYAFYRRCKESKVIPREVSSYIWGGETGSVGAKTAEDWSLAVEKDELGDGSSAFVETGGQLEAGVEANVGIGKLAAAVKGQSGKRYDAESMKKKGGAGEKNKGPIAGRGAQDSIGRDVKNLELNAKADLMGWLAGDVKLGFAKREDPITKKIALEDFEFQLRASGRVPMGSFESYLVELGAKVGMLARDYLAGVFDKATTMTVVGKGAMLGKSVADSALVGLGQMPLTDVVKHDLLGVKKAEPPKDPKDAGKPGQVGIEVAIRVVKSGDKVTATFELRHLTASSANVPKLLEVELTKRKRIMGARYDNGSWSFLK